MLDPLLASFSAAGGLLTIVSEVGQFATILIWALALIIIPMFFYIQAIQTPSEQQGASRIIFAVLLILFTLVFLYKANYIIGAFGGFFDDTLAQGMYYVGMILSIGFGILTTSVAAIIEGNKVN